MGVRDRKVQASNVAIAERGAEIATGQVSTRMIKAILDKDHAVVIKANECSNSCSYVGAV